MAYQPTAACYNSQVLSFLKLSSRKLLYIKSIILGSHSAICQENEGIHNKIITKH